MSRRDSEWRCEPSNMFQIARVYDDSRPKAEAYIAVCRNDDDARLIVAMRSALLRIAAGVDHPLGLCAETALFYEAVKWAQGVADEGLGHYGEDT
jgi:hypothetical protein